MHLLVAAGEMADSPSIGSDDCGAPRVSLVQVSGDLDGDSNPFTSNY